MSNKKEVRKNAAVITKNDITIRYKSGHNDLFPSWRFCQADSDYCRIEQSDVARLIEELVPFETQKWGEIKSAAGGRSHGTNSHYIPVKDIVSGAQKRLIERTNGDFNDKIFSLRLTGKRRLFGFINDTGGFEIWWLDKEHEICPSP